MNKMACSKQLIVIMLALCTPALLFAAGDTSKDIIPRTLNFILFAAILYYFVADHVKNFFVGRAEGIANEFERVQNELKESEKALENARKGVEVARHKAEEVVNNARLEANILKQKIEENAQRELEVITKQHEESIKFEQRRVEQKIIQEVLTELFASSTLQLDKSAYAEILLKKVA